jgi:ABC-type branched-subunit amino acid transport system ATPase component
MVLERGRMVFAGSAETLKADNSILHSAYLAT